MHVQNNLGVTINDIVHSVKVFPNPTGSNVIFDFNVLKTGKVKIDIYNQYGSLIFDDEKKVTTGNGIFLWDAQMQSKGVYYYRITANGNSISSGKIVKI
jgi:hypothetical protein